MKTEYTMSKIWVNGAEIDLATLTPEEIYALLHSENLDYIKPDGMYYSTSISGDGSFDAPYGVASLPNPLTVSVITEGGVETKVYDGSAPTEIRLDDYKSVVDNNTLTGTGSQASPFRVSDDLLLAIDSAYTLSIQTAGLIDGLEDTIESVILFQDEVSAKCDEAIYIANSAVTVAYNAEQIAKVAELLAQSAITEVARNSEDIDKLYDFIATLIYNIDYNDQTDNLEITYVDGSTSNVHISNIAKLESEFADLSAYTAYLAGEIDQFNIDLKTVVVDLSYRSSDHTMIVKFFDGSTKEFTIEEFERIQSILEGIVETLNMQSSAITEINNNIENITEVLNVYSGDITNIYNTIDVIDQYVTNIYNIASGNTDSVTEIMDILAPIAEEFPNAIRDIDIDTTKDASGNITTVLNYTTFSGQTTEVPMIGIDEAINELKNQIVSCVTFIDYDPVDELMTVKFSNGDEKNFYVKPKDLSGRSIPIYFTLIDGAHKETITINGEERNLKTYPVSTINITGTSVELSIEQDADIKVINLNGEILDSNSDLDSLENLKEVRGMILPSNCSNMFQNDINLAIVDVNSDLLINGEKMFADCSALTTFDSNLKTLIIAPFMFDNCCSLTDFSTDMPMLQEGNFMFHNCESLVELTDLNLKRLEDGSAMFADCDSLISVGNLELHKLTNGYAMFSGSSAFTNANVSTPNLITGDSMFYNTKIQSYTGTLKTLKSAEYMFAKCSELTGITMINLNNMAEADYMFAECSKLSYVRLEGLNTSIDLSDTIIDNESASYIAQNVVSYTKQDNANPTITFALSQNIANETLEMFKNTKKWNVVIRQDK